MQLIVYIDDILILAESKEMARDHVMGLLYLLENLGFVISKPKCVLDPMQIIEFLGFSVNSVQQELSLPTGKVKIRAEARHLLEGSPATVRKLSQFLGRLQAATRQFPGPAVLPKVATGTSESAGAVRPRLLSPANPLHRGEGRGCSSGWITCLPGMARPL